MFSIFWQPNVECIEETRTKTFEHWIGLKTAQQDEQKRVIDYTDTNKK